MLGFNLSDDFSGIINNFTFDVNPFSFFLNSLEGNF